MSAVPQSRARATRGPGRPSGGATPLSEEQLLDAAADAVRLHGPLLSMDDIAAQAGVTKPIIYRTIGDKAKVAAALYERLVEDVDRASVAAIAGQPRTPETFRAATRGFFEVLLHNRNLLMFVEHGWGSTDGHEIDELIEESAALYVARFARSPATVDQPAWRRRTWALATVGVLRTTSRLWTFKPYCDIDEVVDDVVAYVLGAHSQPPMHLR